MSLKCLHQKSTGAQWAYSIALTVADIAIVFIAGIIMVFVMYLLNGLNPENLMTFGPSVMTECAVTHCYSSRFLTYPRYIKFNKRQSKWVAFIVYYGYLFVISYISAHCTYQVLKWVWYPRDLPITGTHFKVAYESLIAFHQVTTFIVLTSHNSWFDGILLKNVDPFASAVLQFFATWIVWSFYVNHVQTIKNINQVCGYLQFVPLTNLFSVSVFHELDLKNTFKNLGTRAGYLALATMLVNAFSWCICYGIMYAMFKEDYLSNVLTASDMGHGIWQMAAISWTPHQILGHRISPILFKKMCIRRDGTKKWCYIALYFFIIEIFAILISALAFYYFNRFLFDELVCKVLGYEHNVEKCIEIPWWERPAYFFGFGVGTQYIAFVETKELSRDNPEQHEEKQHDVEQTPHEAKTVDGLEPTSQMAIIDYQSQQ